MTTNNKKNNGYKPIEEVIKEREKNAYKPMDVLVAESAGVNPGLYMFEKNKQKALTEVNGIIDELNNVYEASRYAWSPDNAPRGWVTANKNNPFHFSSVAEAKSAWDERAKKILDPSKNYKMYMSSKDWADLNDWISGADGGYEHIGNLENLRIRSDNLAKYGDGFALSGDAVSPLVVTRDGGSFMDRDYGIVNAKGETNPFSEGSVHYYRDYDGSYKPMPEGTKMREGAGVGADGKYHMWFDAPNGETFYLDHEGNIVKSASHNPIASMPDWRDLVITRPSNVTDEEIIARRKNKNQENASVADDSSWFEFEGFERAGRRIERDWNALMSDGYDFGDLTKVFLSALENNPIDATVSDAIVAAGKGFVGGVEGVADSVEYLLGEGADLVGADSAADWLKADAQADVTNKWFAPLQKETDKHSVLGDKSLSVVEGVGQVAANAVVGYATGGSSLATYGFTAASSLGNSISEAYKAGATDGEAWAYGILNAAGETASEAMFSGIGKVVPGMDKSLTSIDDVAAKRLSSIFQSQRARNVVEYIVKSVAEGGEEVAAGAWSAFAKYITYMDEKSFAELLANENLLEQFISGMLISAITTTGGLRKSNASGRDYITGLTQREQTTVNEIYAVKLAEAKANGLEISKREKAKIYNDILESFKKGEISAYDSAAAKAIAVKYFFESAAGKVTAESESKLAEALEKNGFTAKAAEKIAKSITTAVSAKGELTEAQADLMESLAEDPRVQKAFEQTYGEEGATAKNKKALAEFNQLLDSKTLKTEAEYAKDLESEGYKVSKKGRDISGVKIADVKGGITLEVDGETVAAKEAELSKSDAIAMKAIADTGADVNTANSLLTAYRGSGMTGADFANQIDAGYGMGYAGFSEAGLSNALGRVSPISRQAYTLGQAQRASEAATVKGGRAKGSPATWYLDKSGKATRVTASTIGKHTMAGNQSAAVRTADFLHRIGIGGNVFFFESFAEKKKDGKTVRMFRDQNGIVRAAPNGVYYQENGDIYVDINAGAEGQGIALTTFAHELTHMIQQWSPEKYRVLGDFLAEQYEKKGVSAHEAVKHHQALLSELRGSQVSYTEAYHEWMAESMSTLFNDGKLYDKLLALKKLDKGLFSFLKRQIDKLARLVRKFYSGLMAETDAARFVQLLDPAAVDRLQQLFADALVEAGDTYAHTETTKNTTDDGGVQYSVRLNQVDVEGNVYEKVVKPGLVDYQKSRRSKNAYINILVRKIFPRKIHITDENTHSIVVEFAKQGETVNNHPVLGEFTENTDQLKRIALFNIKELLQISKPQQHKGKDRHGWLDHNGWSNRITYMLYDEKIYPVIIHIANARDGRNILYDISVLTDKGVGLDKGATPHDTLTARESADYLYDQQQAVKKPTPSGEMVPQQETSVNPQKSDRITTQAFKSWFGDWQNNPEAASKIVNADGTNPDIRYQDRLQPTGDDVADALESVAGKGDMLTVERYREAYSKLSQEEAARRDAMAELRQIETGSVKATPDEIRKLRTEANRAHRMAEQHKQKLAAVENSIPYKRMTQRLAANGFVVERNTNEEGMTVYDYVYRKLVTGTKVADMLDRVALKEDELTVKRYREAYKELATWEAAYANTMRDIEKAEQRKDPDTARVDRLKAQANKAARMMEQGRKNLQTIESSKAYQRMITELRSQGYNVVRTAREDGVTVYRYSEPATDANWISKREVERKRTSNAEAYYEEREAKLRAEFAKKLESADAYHEERYERREAEYRESREREAERAEKSKLRKKIRRVAEQLRSITEKAPKERRTKEVLRPLAESAIRVADLVFLENYNEYDMVRNGVGNALSDKHQDLMDECRSLLERLDREMERVAADENPGTEIHDRWDPDAAMAKDDRVEAIKKELARKMAILRNDDVFQAEFKRLNDFDANQLLTEMYNAYKDLETAEDAFIKDAYRAEIGYKIEAVKKSIGAKAVRDMTISELEQVYQLYYAIHHTITTANQVFADGQKLDDVAKDTVQEFREAQKEPGEIRRVARAVKDTLGWLYEKPIYALERVGSQTFTRLWKNLFDSENITMQDVHEADQYMLQQVEKHGYNKWKVNKKVDKTFSDLGGKEFRLTLGEIMTLYAYQRRGTVFNHIQESGFEIKSKGLTEANPADTYRVSKEMVEHITGLLTAEQKAFVVAMQTYLSDVMGEKGNETSMKMLGLKLFGEKNYFPVKTAGNWMARAAEATAKETKGFAVLKNAGFTKAQNENATTAIALDDFMSVWTDHVWDMSLYHGAVPALEDIRRVMNYSAEGQAVKASLVNSYGEGALKYFDELYRNANGAAVMDRVERRIKKAVSLFRKSAVAYSLSVAIQQPGSIYRAMAVVPKKYFGFHGFGTITKAAGRSIFRKIPGNKFKEIYARMVKYAPGVTLAKEIGGFDVSGRGVSAYLMDTEKSLLGKLKTEKASGKASAVMDLIDDNIIANIPNAMDKLAWVEIWNACENETADLRRDLKKGSEEFYKAVGERFTDVIRTTQVYDSIFAKSPLLRSRSMAVQMATSFMNEANTIANMAESAVRDAARGNWKSAARKAYFLVQSQVITSALWALVAAMRDDDEDETFVEKYVEHFLEKLVDSFNPIEYIPGKDPIKALFGETTSRPDTELFTRVGNAYSKVNKLSEKDTEGMSEEQRQQHENDVQAAQWNLALEVANVFGIPAKNIRRDANAVINFFGMDFVEGTTWESVKQKAEAALFDTPAQESLYNALMSGDEEYIARIRGGYETESDFNNAASKALRAYDPRIRQAAKAELAGNIRERQRIAEKILAEGNFDKEVIVSAISSEVNALDQDNGESKEPKKKSWYDSDDIYTAVSGGDMELLDEIRQEYISTAEANGKDAEDGVKSFESAVNTAVKEAFTAGAIAADEALALRMQYSNEDEEAAAETVAWWNFQAENPDYDDLSKSHTIKWLEFAQKTGIDLEVYDEFCKQYPKLKDEDGKKDKKAIKKLIEEIADEENLTYSQKKALKKVADV